MIDLTKQLFARVVHSHRSRRGASQTLCFGGLGFHVTRQGSALTGREGFGSITIEACDCDPGQFVSLTEDEISMLEDVRESLCSRISSESKTQ